MSSAPLESLSATEARLEGLSVHRAGPGQEAAATYQGSPFVGWAGPGFLFVHTVRALSLLGAARPFSVCVFKKRGLRSCRQSCVGAAMCLESTPGPRPHWLAGLSTEGIRGLCPHPNAKARNSVTFDWSSAGFPHSCGMPMGYHLCPGLTSVSRYPHLQVLVASLPVAARKPQLTPPSSAHISPRACLHQIFHSPPQESKDGWTQSPRPVRGQMLWHQCAGKALKGRTERGHEAAHGALGKASRLGRALCPAGGQRSWLP